MPNVYDVNVTPAKASVTGDSTGFLKYPSEPSATTPWNVQTLVVTDDLTDSLITTPKIADEAVTQPKLGIAAVENENIASEAVTPANVRSVATAAASLDFITGLATVDETQVFRHLTPSGNGVVKASADGTSTAYGLIENDNITDGTIALSKLVESVQHIIEQTPEFERGQSNSLSIPANSALDGEVTFTTAKADTPSVFIEVEDSTGTNYSTCVTSVSTTEFHWRIINNSGTDATGITLTWAAFSGR